MNTDKEKVEMCRGELVFIQDGKYASFCKKWNIFIYEKNIKNPKEVEIRERES